MSNVLKIENNYSWLITDNDKLRVALWTALRWKERDYFHNARYRMKLWDGFKNFFDKDTGKFLTGLLPEVKMYLKTTNNEYTCDDKRDLFKFNVETVDENFLGHGIELRDYQVEYVNQTIRNRRGIVFAPTSAGKTNILIGILKTIPANTPTLILANRKSLVDQTYEEIKKAGIANVGRFYGGIKEANVITCSTVQSAHLLKSLLPKIKCLLVDEIHEMMSKKPKQIYAACKAASVRVGFSATPFKFGDTDKCQKFEVKGFIGPVFLAKNTETGKLTTKDLQNRKILAKSECIFRPIRSPELPYHTYIDAVTDGIAQNDDFHAITKRLVDTLDGRILIIVERLEHGDRLMDLIPGAVWVRGQDDLETRKIVINRLKEEKGKVVAIATSGIFNTGLNVFVHHLLNNAGGAAEHQIVQRFGRGLRVAEDKDGVVYHDWFFHNNTYLTKHSKKRVAVLQKEGHTVTVLEELDI
jgi:superfamily II DNA or RNA helicase